MVAMCIWKMDELEVWVCVHVQLCRYNGAYFQLAQDALVLLPIWHRTQKYYCSSLEKKRPFADNFGKIWFMLEHLYFKDASQACLKLECEILWWCGFFFFFFGGGSFVCFFLHNEQSNKHNHGFSP